MSAEFQPQAAGGLAGGLQARAGGGLPPDPAVIAEHHRLTNYLMLVVGCTAAALLLWRFYNLAIQKIRHVACLNNEKQRYFSIPDTKLSFIKLHGLYAPMFRKRHNREIQMSSAVNFGTLPTRLEFLFLVGYFATNVIFSVISIPWWEQNVEADTIKTAATFRDRTGILAVVNMVPLFLMAGRNNPLINLLGMSFDQFNLLHRWFGRIAVLEAVVHTIAHLWKATEQGSYADAWAGVFAAPFMIYGFVVSTTPPNTNNATRL
ncbi:ferric reductase-like transmembrane domain-containing protein [Candidatus Bathyarchaeota archaeon]|nr:ferric reductase-like transmembrane domain-containing protein [Candidatus Bathyarchaeota archaeon]